MCNRRLSKHPILVIHHPTIDYLIHYITLCIADFGLVIVKAWLTSLTKTKWCWTLSCWHGHNHCWWGIQFHLDGLNSRLWDGKPEMSSCEGAYERRGRIALLQFCKFFKNLCSNQFHHAILLCSNHSLNPNPSSANIVTTCRVSTTTHFNQAVLLCNDQLITHLIQNHCQHTSKNIVTMWAVPIIQWVISRWR